MERVQEQQKSIVRSVSDNLGDLEIAMEKTKADSNRVTKLVETLNLHQLASKVDLFEQTIERLVEEVRRPDDSLIRLKQKLSMDERETAGV